MIEVRPGGRRRIDRVLDPAYMQGVAYRTLEEVRALRDETAQEETDLSYLRRLLHGRIDIVHAERAQGHGRLGRRGGVAGRRSCPRTWSGRPPAPGGTPRWNRPGPRHTGGTSRRWCPTWTCPTSAR